MGHFDRNIISIYNDEDLNEAEVILKRTVESPVRQLPLAAFQEHGKQDDDDDDEDSTDKLTNQSVGGVQRARNLAQENGDDSLPAVYGGLFTVTEYFTRSFDAVKGRFFEKVIAAEEESQRLDIDRELGNLLPYLLEPESCWKSLDFTRESPTDDKENTLEELEETLTLNLSDTAQGAQSDATLLFPDDGVLVFGEQRTSVVSGGITARPALIKKPRELLRELMKSNDVINVPQETEEEHDISAGTHTLAEIFDEVGVEEIHFHIGILFNEKRTPARWDEDPQQSGSREALREVEEVFTRNYAKDPRNLQVDQEELCLDVDIPVTSNGDKTISFHLSFLYGDIYLNTIYTGSLDAVGPDGSLEAFESPVSLRDVISENESDDLWLTFSIAERESKVYEMTQRDTNNAMEIADLILDNDDHIDRLVELRRLCKRGEREKADKKLIALASDIAKDYAEGDNYARYVYDGSPVDYLRDVAIVVIMYHLISRPLFLRRFPDSTPPEPEYEKKDVNEASLEDISYTFETYLFDYSEDTTKKQNIFSVIRSQTTYKNSGTDVPESENDEIDWDSALTKEEVGEILDIRTPTKILKNMSIADNVKSHKGGVLKKNGDKFAVPALVSHRMGKFMNSLPKDAILNDNQATLPNL